MFPLPLLVSSPRFLQQIKPNYSCWMRGLPPRPVSILFLVIMTALLERHVANWCFCCFRFKEVFGQLQEQPWGRADGGEGRTRGRWYRDVTFDPGSREKRHLHFSQHVYKDCLNTHASHICSYKILSWYPAAALIPLQWKQCSIFFIMLYHLWLDTTELITIICKKKRC